MKMGRIGVAGFFGLVGVFLGGLGAVHAGTVSGACCLADASCSDVIDSECDALGGVFQPDVSCNGASCGACCTNPGAACEMRLEATCTTPLVFGGEGTQCDDDRCPGCCTCAGDESCAQECTSITECICEAPCIATIVRFADCDSGCEPENPGCCLLGEGCFQTDEFTCQLSSGLFVEGEMCLPEGGCSGQPFCCRCEGEAAACQGPCREVGITDFTSCIEGCPIDECVVVLQESSCEEGCLSPGCCQFEESDQLGQACAAFDPEFCVLGGGTFHPGESCNPGTGLCGDSTTTPTPTPVPEGGSCEDGSECAPGLVCIEGVCQPNVSPAPAAGGGGLLAGIAALIAIAGFTLWRGRSQSVG